MNYLRYFFKKYDVYIYILLLLTFMIYCYFLFYGINNDILAFHGFRQSQTALSTYFFIKDGIKIFYETPILGAPWSIPMEFPTYQIIVSLISKYSLINLDIVGKLISLFFWGLSIFFIYKILSLFEKSLFNKIILILLILINPIYIYWSKSFMIESTALFFSLGYLYFFIVNFENITIRKNIILFLFALFAILTKVTTFIIFFVISIIYLVGSFYKLSFKRQFLYIFIKNYFPIFFLTFSIYILWNYNIDILKSNNPLAYFITTVGNKSWIWGDISMRFDYNNWNMMFNNSRIFNLLGIYQVDNFKIPINILVLVFVLFSNIKYKINILVSFILFIFPLLIFTNLYRVHDYYFFVNGLFLSVFYGYLLISLIEFNSIYISNLSKYILLPLFIFLNFSTYNNTYFLGQIFNNDIVHEASRFVIENTKEDHVMLIYGWDWDSTFPYYSKRKAIMDRENRQNNDINFQKSIKNTGKENIKILVVNNSNNYDQNYRDLILQKIDYFGFENPPKKFDYIDVYLKD